MKKALLFPYVLLLVIEWLADMIVRILQVVHKSIETLTLALENKINEPTKPINSD